VKERPDQSLGLALRAPAGSSRPEAGAGVKTARDEVWLEVDGADPPRVDGGLRVTPRAAYRAVKWARRRGAFEESRRQLLLRHAFEHPLMILLDVEHGCFCLHAATAMKDGEAVMFLGGNGAGKTSAAVQLVREGGYRLLADNFTPCDGSSVHGFPGRTRPKEPGRRDQLQLPEPLTARVSSVVLLNAAGRSGEVGRERRLAELQSYIAREREDHRDSPLFPVLAGRLGRDVRSSDQRVIRTLAEVRMVEYDWRRQRLPDALGRL
jgi:hypothetical protein